MEYKVNDFPIFKRYLGHILLRVGLAEGTYSHILEVVGEYSVSGRCECGDETCCTVHMSSDSLVGKDVTYCFGFNIGYIIFNFYEDGALHVESLADSNEEIFPFKQELVDVLGGKKVEYDDAYAARVVRSFMGRLEQCEVEKIDVL